MIRNLLPALVCICLATHTKAAVLVYDESISGDLSDDYLIPHVFTPPAGTLTIKGSVVDGDRDLFTFDIGAGLTLTSIKLLSYVTDPENPENLSYFMSQPGATLSAPPADDFAESVGYVGFGSWAVGRELIRILTVGPPYDYAATLGPGSYAFWVNETGPTSSYQFQFTVVPEPGTPLLALPALALLLRRKRHRRG